MNNSVINYMNTTNEQIDKANDAKDKFLTGYSKTDFEAAQRAVNLLKPQPSVNYTISPVLEVYNAQKNYSDSIYNLLQEVLSENEVNVRISLLDNEELLLEKQTIYPYYLNKGDVLYINASTTVATEIKVWDANSKKLKKTLGKKTKFAEKLAIENSSIYLIEILPTSSLYFDIHISKATDQKNWNEKVEIKQKVEECEKTDFMAYPISTIGSPANTLVTY